MPEMPHTRESHHNALLIRCIDHFLITHRSTRLYDGCGTSTDHDVQSVAEREERIRRYRRTGERQTGVLSL